MNVKTAALAMGIGVLGMGAAEACSLAFHTGQIAGGETHLTGRTTDSVAELGIALDHTMTISPRGVQRNGNTVDGSLANPAQWTSKYGSLTVEKLAGGGVNEKGLSVDGLMLDKAVYATPDQSTPCVSNLKVVTYLLDNAATVQECLDLINNVLVVGEKILGNELGMHIAVRDASNDMAIIEFVNGGTKKSPMSKTVVYRGTEYDVATNEPPMPQQLKYYKKFSDGKKGLGGDYNSYDRFVRLKMFNKTLPEGSSTWENVCNVFQLMDTVHTVAGAVDYSMKEFDYVNKETHKGKKTYAHMWPNIWTSVTDHDNLTFYFKMAQYPNTVWVDLKKIDFETLAKTGTLDPRDFSLTGEVSGKFTWQ